MKYYYNGIKVRTSDNAYTHGVYYNGKIIACCGRYDLAVKRLTQEYNYRQEQIRQNDNVEYVKELERRLETLTIVELEVRA